MGTAASKPIIARPLLRGLVGGSVLALIIGAIMASAIRADSPAINSDLTMNARCWASSNCGSFAAPVRPVGQKQAEALLQRARVALGGRARLVAVKALSAEYAVSRKYQVERIENGAWRMLLPDRFQWRNGDIVHTIDGEAFWQNRDNAAAILELAERNVRTRFARVALLFLLRDLPSFPLSAHVVHRTDEDLSNADVVEFTGPDGFDLRLCFDPKTHRPLGYSEPQAYKGATVWRVLQLQDYRESDGIQFPHRLVATISGRVSSITVFHRITVNPSIVANDFHKR